MLNEHDGFNSTSDKVKLVDSLSLQVHLSDQQCIYCVIFKGRAENLQTYVSNIQARKLNPNLEYKLQIVHKIYQCVSQR
ncbi:hypothetical protein EG68_11678 [Paragonimus skrjabini miyazakii]|uniref:Uncharacterized protein n=1 Tax=Paragonimus skrjabini miyazakii TaxID=59628 RepID=A0A8S9YD32_9TREM|nr:hypothetical protein EG68_11678 [Paragonimus skrjabini miyazakii]